MSKKVGHAPLSDLASWSRKMKWQKTPSSLALKEISRWHYILVWLVKLQESEVCLRFLCCTVDGWNPAPPAMSCMIASLMLPPATPIISKLDGHPRWCRISAIRNCLPFLDLSSCNVNIQGVQGKPFSYKVVQDFGHQQYESMILYYISIYYIILYCIYVH